MDCTVWPANISYVQSAIQMISSMISMSPNNAGFVQLPVPHASTVASALLKHCRLLEDGLSKGGLDVLTTVTILFFEAGEFRA